MPFFFSSWTRSGLYPCACIHCRANRTGEYQKAPSTKVMSAATRTATMLTLAVGIGSPLGAGLRDSGAAASVGPAHEAGPAKHQASNQRTAAPDQPVLLQQPEPAEQIVPVVFA